MYLIILQVVLACRVGLGLAIDGVILVPAASVVAAGALVRQIG